MRIDSYSYFKGTPRRLAESAGYDGPFLHDKAEMLHYGAPYGHVYTHKVDRPVAPGEDGPIHEVLEEAFERHNRGDRPLGRFVGAMSPGDVIVVTLATGNDWNASYTKRAFLCKSVGFEEIEVGPFEGDSDYLVHGGSAPHFVAFTRELEDRYEERRKAGEVR